MAVYNINKGLDLPISGTPSQTIEDGPPVDTVAVVATDFVGMKPKMHCKVGDIVQRGQLLFEDRKTPGVRFTAPGAGEVIAINRGARRVLISVVIALSEGERAGRGEAEQVAFAAYTGQPVASLRAEQVRALLLESGAWSWIRARPFSTVADPSTSPSSIFVTAIDTRPLAPSPDVIIAEREADFQRGLAAVAKLAPKTFLCKSADSPLLSEVDGVTVSMFGGKHPAGLVGTHIHMLDPVSRKKVVWHLNYQDVIAIGQLMATGTLDVSRVVSLAGPPVHAPRLLRTRRGAALAPLVAGQLADVELRIISGDVLSGRTAMGDVEGYLSHYDLQISALEEDRTREFIGWLRPGADKFSTVWTYLGGLIAGKKFAMTTSTHGEPREMVPIGMYERVMPLDILPTFLLRALVTEDLERAEQLGALELDEEDLALCSFVCPGKQNYGVELRHILEIIRKEG